MIRYVALHAAVCMTMSGVYALRAAPPPASVCDLLANPQSFNHKLIAVRGVQVATGEGVWLDGNGCTKRITAGGYQWPDIMWIELSDRVRREAGFNVEPLRTDVARIDAQLKKQDFNPRRDRLWITYVGRFETYDDFEHHVLRDSAGSRGIGFGHLNSAPAMLIVTAVRDAFVERRAIK